MAHEATLQAESEKERERGNGRGEWRGGRVGFDAQHDFATSQQATFDTMYFCSDQLYFCMESQSWPFVSFSDFFFFLITYSFLLHNVWINISVNHMFITYVQYMYAYTMPAKFTSWFVLYTIFNIHYDLHKNIKHCHMGSTPYVAPTYLYSIQCNYENARFLHRSEFFSKRMQDLVCLSQYRYCARHLRSHELWNLLPSPVPTPVACSWGRGHQPSHQGEPGGAVIERVLAVAEEVRSLLGARVWACVVHKGLVVHEVLHFALPLVRQLRDVRVGRGEGGRRGTVRQVLVHAAVEYGGAA